MPNQPVILYVEDDPMSRQVMEMLVIRAMGIKNLTIFEDSVDFVARLEAITPPPDVILLDIHMRPHTGFEMLDMIRSHPHFVEAKVVAVTASVMNEEVDMLKTVTFNGGIGKPLDATIFPDFLRRIINGEEIWHVA